MKEHRELWWPTPASELASVVELDTGDGFGTVLGGRLDRIQVAYESWGKLNDTGDNAVLVIHPLTTDSHVTGDFDGQPQGWWEPLFGPGRAIDTDRYHVICPNLLGSCYGTTGPWSPAADGEPYLDRFPLLTPLDLMRFQALFLDRLGIARVRLVIGPSMGGMVAWEWAIEGGDRAGAVAAVAAPLRTTALQIGLNWLQRRGIEIDLAGDGGKLRGGQRTARGIGMLSYRAPAGLEEKFGREWFKQPGSTLAEAGTFNVESWLKHHGKRSVKRFDPYTYRLLSRTMDLHDVALERGSVDAALRKVDTRVLAVGISSDQLYSAAEVRQGAESLARLGGDGIYEEIDSPHGHDAFLLESEQLAAILGRFLGA